MTEKIEECWSGFTENCKDCLHKCCGRCCSKFVDWLKAKMGICALPIVFDCCMGINLRTGMYIIIGYIFISILFHHVIIINIFECNKIAGAFWTAAKVFRIISAIVKTLALVVLVIGVVFHNTFFLRVFIIVGLVCFFVDMFIALTHMVYLVLNLERCQINGFISGCVGLMLPVFFLYCIIVVHSYKREIE